MYLHYVSPFYSLVTKGAVLDLDDRLSVDVAIHDNDI